MTPMGLARAAKGAAKRTMVASLATTGALAAWTSVKLRRRPIVLTYHRVLAPAAVDQSWSHPAIIVTQPTFAMHMRLLRREFNVISLDEFVARIESHRPFDPNSCLVTFDDGWRDTYDEAWPILQECRIPAVVFLSTGFIGTARMFWQEEIGAALVDAWRRARADEAFRRRAQAQLAEHGLDGMLAADESSSRATALTMVRDVKGRMVDTRPIVDALRALNGAPARTPVDAFMDWDQVEEMYAGGVAFGGHGVSHRLLPALSTGEARDEVTQSRQDIEARLGAGVRAFAYPNGDWNADVAEAVRDAGYAVAFGTAEGPVDAGDRYALRRVNMHEGPTAHPSMFIARVAGVI